MEIVEVAGRRIHGTTGHDMPLAMFEQIEQAPLLPIDDEPHDVPVWRSVTVHPDHHVSLRVRCTQRRQPPARPAPDSRSAGIERWSSSTDAVS
jgi:hypothetical protein